MNLNAFFTSIRENFIKIYDHLRKVFLAGKYKRKRLHFLLLLLIIIIIILDRTSRLIEKSR